jgi:hypothetical protein
MSRLARDFSWHLFALAIVVAGLGVFAPLTWWQVRQPRISQLRGSPRQPRDSVPSVGHVDDAELQVAELRPPVADQIDLDPSITETPALPVAASAQVEQPTPPDAGEELRLSATMLRDSQPRLPDIGETAPLSLSAEPNLPEPHVIPEQPIPTIPATKAWPYPAALIEQLQAVAAAVPQAALWTANVKRELERIVSADTLADSAVEQPLANLQRLTDEGKRLAQMLPEQSRSKVLRAGYAIVRRIVIWDQVHALAATSDSAAAPIVDRDAWTSALAEVDTLLQATGAAANWRKHLLIDRARDDFDSSACSPTDQRRLARDILHRLHSTQLSHDQEKFLKTPPFTALGEQLRARAAELPDLHSLLVSIEQHELDDRSDHARAMAVEYNTLRWSSAERVRELAETVNAYYRNANVRVAISADLVNRFLPQSTQQLEAVEDVIQGAWVSGQSNTNTKLRVALVPDRQRWNIGLEANGQVASDTSSSKGPATFYQNGWSFFRARKRLTVDRRGIRLFNAEAEANANNNLSDFETDFDGIPLVGGLVRSIARSQYDSSQPAAKVEVEGKIIVRATSQLDREVANKLELAKRDFQVKMVDPLRKLHLEPTAVDMETTAERLIGRYRIAARDHVSAHTPRPQAPGDSMLSVQVHESALNNVLDQLSLAGRRVELRELFREMTSRFSQEQVPIPEDLPEDVHVTFADEDPVRVDCQDGRVRLTIRLKELSQAGTRNRWSDFTVRGYYGPSADQLDANLQREGTIELIGERRHIPIGQQVALRGIFSTVMSRNRKLHVINKQLAEAKELSDQQVTQFVIHDGWIGVALGPKSAGREAAMQPRVELNGE